MISFSLDPLSLLLGAGAVLAGFGLFYLFKDYMRLKKQERKVKDK